MYYESERDVELRLRNSIVMFKDRPVQVVEVLSQAAVKCQDLLTDKLFDSKISSLNLDPSAMPLGYVMTDDNLYFCQRRPTRRFKQGLTRENLFSFDALNKPADKELIKMMRNGEGMRGHINPYCSAMARAIMGKYPSVGEAFQKVRNGDSKAVPFSREWAVADKDDELCLLYRGEVVGYVGDTSVKLNKEHFYLKESLELCLK